MYNRSIEPKKPNSSVQTKRNPSTFLSQRPPVYISPFSLSFMCKLGFFTWFRFASGGIGYEVLNDCVYVSHNFLFHCWKDFNGRLRNFVVSCLYYLPFSIFSLLMDY